MQVSVVQNGRVLRQINYRQEQFIETPDSGNYSIRIHNDSHRRRMIVLSVDGVNVVNGENAGFDGPGYVFNPWQTADIPGFRRTNGEVAAFTFKADDASYAAQTGRGTNNVGVIGVAVFDEKVIVRAPTITVTKEIHHHHHHNPILWSSLGENTRGLTDVTWNSSDSVVLNSTATNDTDASATFCNMDLESAVPAAGPAAGAALSEESSHTKSARSKGSITRQSVTRVGTGYGERVEFRTTDTDFTKATKKPNFLATFRYGTREQLISWGVPIDAQDFRPNAFPASLPNVAVQAPPGWRG